MQILRFSGLDFKFRDRVFRGRFLNFDGIFAAFWLILAWFFQIFRVVVQNFASHLAEYPKYFQIFLQLGELPHGPCAALWLHEAAAHKMLLT